MSTPIDILFHHNANCSCEQCQKTVKPFRNGKFLSREELEQINNDIQSLAQENQKLQAMLEKLAEEKIHQQKAIAQEKAIEQEKADQVAAQEEEQKSAPSRNLTITIDTSNLVYIVVIVVLLIMVMKK